ncbi:MAG TPA: Uma2 family endonuclease [Polyangiaceae bacterium]|nr:Uma2 family endonuclease [Polyangiaceae bacterium]HMR76260.1 Uma2 family endonuclease [Polyangiaceae bacterium]
MSEPAKKKATYADVLAAPAHRVAELVSGTLVTSPRPAAPHAHAASVLGMDIGSPFQRGRGGPGGWWILYEPELHFDEDVVVPDLAGWRRERMPVVPNVPYFTLPPDWLCEVLSPSTEAFDRADKLRVYAGAGVSWVWLVNPLLRTLEVLHLENDSWTVSRTLRGDGLQRIDPFSAIELNLGDLWLQPEPGE